MKVPLTKYLDDEPTVKKKEPEKALGTDDLDAISQRVAEILEKPKKTSEAQRRANDKYTAKFKRVTARLTPELYEKIKETGESTNSIINKALEQYFA